MKAVFIALFFLIAGASYALQTVVIKGDISNLDGHQIAVAIANPARKPIKKADALNGIFEVSISIEDVQELAVYPFRYKKNVISDLNKKAFYAPADLVFFASPGDTITITGDAMKLWQATVSGGALEKEYHYLSKQLLPVFTQYDQLKFDECQLRLNNDTISAAKLKEQQTVLNKQLKSITKSYYATHTDNAFALFKLHQDMKRLQADELESIFDKYNSNLQQTYTGKAISTYLEKSKTVAKGVKMVDFTGHTLTGAAFDSKELRGKFVLLDFWGSWCGPCRKSNPHLKELFKKYNGKGFEIVGIAHEINPDIKKAKAALKKAVAKDGLTWVQIFNNELKDHLDLVTTYNISSFPTKILINKEGQIIWKGVGTEDDDIDERLKAIFKF